jgi:hypothetical protein
MVMINTGDISIGMFEGVHYVNLHDTTAYLQGYVSPF